MERTRAGVARGVWWSLAGITGLGAALRLARLPGTSLAYDGLQSVTHAVRGVPVSIVSAWCHDPHPPLYYVLLGAWMSFGTSDAWVLGLSALLSLALVPSAWYVARRHYGERAGLVAAFVCAVHPLALYWSDFARMYALLMLLSIWAWHFNLRALEGDRLRWQAVLGVAATQLGLVYSHIAGPLFAGCIALGAALERAPERGALRRWLKLQLGIAVLAAPQLMYPLHSHPGHMRRPDLAELWRTLSLQVSSAGETTTPWMAAGAAAFVALVATLLARRETRGFAACLLVLPFAAAALVSHAIEPIWFGSRLFAFVVPFVALGIGRLAGGGRLGRRPVAGLVAAACLALVVRGGLAYTVGYEKHERFAEAAAILHEQARPGDLVLVANLKVEWALAWYLVGPDWARGAWTGGRIEALRQVLDPARRPAFIQRLAGWGSDVGGALPGVVPASEDRNDVLNGAARVWLLTLDPGQRDPLLARYELGPETRSFALGGLDLSLHESTTGAIPPASGGALAHSPAAP